MIGAGGADGAGGALSAREAANAGVSFREAARGEAEQGSAAWKVRALAAVRQGLCTPRPVARLPHRLQRRPKCPCRTGRRQG